MNNAAVVHGKSLMDSDDDALLKSQHVNTMGQFWVRLLDVKEEAGLHVEARGISPRWMSLMGCVLF